MEGSEYGPEVDIWCLGVLTFEMVCGKAPFYNASKKKTIENIKQVQMM